MVFNCIICILSGIVLGIILFCSLYYISSKRSIRIIKNLTMDQISKLALWPQSEASADEVAWIIEACFDVLLNREIHASDYILTKASIVLAAITGAGSGATDVSNIIREGRRIMNESIGGTKGVRIKL